MYELQEFEKNAKEKRKERGSLRKALEDGRLRPIAMRLPKLINRRSSETESKDRCGIGAKIIIAIVIVSLLGMLCYAIWRIKDIEEPSEATDYDYRMIVGPEESEDSSVNDVDGT